MEHNIAGIYNICDRWCERCFYTSKCRLYATEEETDKALDEKGIEDDSERLMESLKSSFSDVANMLDEYCEREGIDFEALEESIDDSPYEEPDESRFDEVKSQSNDLAKLCFAQFGNIKEGFKTKGLDALRPEYTTNPKTAEKYLRKVAAAIDVVEWHCTFIGAKVHRMAMEMADPEFEDVTLTFEGVEYSMQKLTARLLWVCLLEMQEAVLTIYQSAVIGHGLLSELIQLLEKIKAQVLAFNPGIDQYKRPYFDR